MLLVAILSMGLFKAPTIKPPPENTIDVTLVDDVALRSATRNPAPAASAQAPELGPVEEAAPSPAPEPKPAEEAAPPPPKPEPKPALKPAPAPKPAPKPQPKPTPTKVAAVAPAPDKSKAKPSPAKAVTKPSTTKSETASSATKPSNATKPGKKSSGLKLNLDFAQGSNTDSSAKPSKAAPAPLGAADAQALNQVISNQIYRHLRLPSGADVELLVALLEVRLDRSGAVIGTPSVLDVQGVTDSNRPQVGVYRERAIQAVMQASPFQNLPPEYYGQWKWLKPLRVKARNAQ